MASVTQLSNDPSRRERKKRDNLRALKGRMTDRQYFTVGMLFGLVCGAAIVLIIH